MRVSCDHQSGFVLQYDVCVKMMLATGTIARACFPFFSMVYLCDVGFPSIGELSAYLGRCFRSVFKFSAGANSLPKLVNQTKKEPPQKATNRTPRVVEQLRSIHRDSRVAGKGPIGNLRSIVPTRRWRLRRHWSRRERRRREEIDKPTLGSRSRSEYSLTPFSSWHPLMKLLLSVSWH